MTGTNRGFNTRGNASKGTEMELFFFPLIVKESRTEKEKGCWIAKECSENY